MQDFPQSRDDHWPGAKSRPTSIDELMRRMQWFRSVDSAEHTKDLSLRSDDVFISTYPKCGTTWTQQIVQLLRTGGDMDFDEITEVVPWFESAHDIQIDINADQPGQLRAFKTHRLPSELPSGARHIFVTRDPARVALSFYRFFDGWMLEAGSVDLATFVEQMFLAGSRSGTWWGHLLEWWPLRKSDDVLFLCYEDMLEDPRAAIGAVAHFCGISRTPELITKTLEYSSIEHMRKHSTQFDDHLVRAFRDPAMGIPKGGTSDKVSEEATATKLQLSDRSRALLEARWNETIRPALGMVDYAALRAAVGGIPELP